MSQNPALLNRHGAQQVTGNPGVGWFWQSCPCLFFCLSIFFYQTCRCWKDGNWKLAVTQPCLQILIAFFIIIQFGRIFHPPSSPNYLPESHQSDQSWTPLAPRRRPCLLLTSLPAHLLVSSSICQPITSLVNQAIHLLLPELWPANRECPLWKCSQNRGPADVMS